MMRPLHLAAGYALAAFMLAAIVLAGCAQDGGLKVNRQTIELAALSGLKAGAEIYVGLKPCLDGQDFIHDRCAKPAIASKVRLAIPLAETAIEVLRPLVNSTDQAAIDRAMELARKATDALTEARSGQ